MSGFLAILLILSFPIFYLYGAITFFRKIFRKNNKPRAADKNYDSIEIPKETDKKVTVNKNEQNSFKSLDNINILLYLGAFFIIVAGSIFVGFSYESLSGGIKTLLLLITATAFYLSGIGLYTQTKKIKPAGLTFASIGLFLFPLVGVAAYNFMSLPSSYIWFLTSLITGVLYFFSYRILKKTFISYLMIFTSLSLFESTISLINVPVYYYGWVMSLSSIAFMLISKQKRFDPVVARSLQFSSNIFLPLSLLLSFFIVPDSGIFQVGINCIFAGVYYDLLSIFEPLPDTRNIYFSIALLLFPIGAQLLIGDYFSSYFNLQTGIAISSIGIGYIYLMELYERYKISWRSELLGIFGGIIMSCAVLLTIEEPIMVIVLLLLAGAGNMYVSIRRNNPISLFVFGMTSICIPYWAVFKVMGFEYESAQAFFALMHLGLGVMFMSMIPYIRKIPHSKLINRILTGFTLLISFAAFSAGDGVETMVLYPLLIGYIFYLSFQQDLELGSGLAVFLCYAYIEKVVSITFLYPSIHAVLLSLVGSICYVASGLINDQTRQKIIKGSSLVGMYYSAYLMWNQDPISLFGPLFLTLAAGFSYSWGYQHKSHVVRYAAGAVAVIAFQWLCSSYLNIEESLFYTTLWFGYFAVLAYQFSLRDQEQEKDVCTFLSLAFLTFPLALQAFSDPFRGLWLILISIGIVLAGMKLKYQLILRWGVVALVIEVLYQLRDFFANIPAWVIFGGIGLVLLFGSIYLLSRRKES